MDAIEIGNLVTALIFLYDEFKENAAMGSRLFRDQQYIGAEFWKGLAAGKNSAAGAIRELLNATVVADSELVFIYD